MKKLPDQSRIGKESFLNNQLMIAIYDLLEMKIFAIVIIFPE
jgi:hypothetical protein